MPMKKAKKQGRATAYSPVEVQKLLEYVKEVLPMGPDQWEDVGVLFRNHFIGAPYPRETESLKQKFKTLRNLRKPTGNPTCPPGSKLCR